MNRFRHFCILAPIIWGVLVVRWMTMPIDIDAPNWLPAWADKPAHAAVFGLFAWLCLLPLRVQFSRSAWTSALWALGMAVAFGAWTEYLQLALDYRTGTLGDVLANAVGALTVLAFPLWLPPQKASVQR